MSYSLSVYVVDLDVLRGSAGSGDTRLRRMIGGRFKRHLASFDDQFDHSIDDGAPPIYEAIGAVIDGGPYDERFAHMYHFAYKWICEFHGRFLDNDSFSPFRSGWPEQVDEELKGLGITAVSVAEFGYGAPPKLPRVRDVHGYGEWSPAECQKALTQWEAVTPERKAALDPYVLEAVEQCLGWCRSADAAGRGVAGFFG
ncbi:hypothetical protein ACIBFB_06120 [Nocardiopsis sp. NPDC050513]|uniref:DUF7691 family protein n=1 Tax=Nocardiopsis sp. NPDC050513 TaxID=3364338 RepID=UPI0037A2637F